MNGTSVGGLVNSTEGGLTTILFGGTNAEGEDRGVNQLLVDHLIERWGDVVHGDGVISKTENTVEPWREMSAAKFMGYSERVTHLPKAKARPGSLVASAKSWPLMVMSPMVSTSLETKPSMEPLP